MAKRTQVFVFNLINKFFLVPGSVEKSLVVELPDEEEEERFVCLMLTLGYNLFNSPRKLWITKLAHFRDDLFVNLVLFVYFAHLGYCFDSFMSR